MYILKMDIHSGRNRSPSPFRFSETYVYVLVYGHYNEVISVFTNRQKAQDYINYKTGHIYGPVRGGHDYRIIKVLLNPRTPDILGSSVIDVMGISNDDDMNDLE